MKSKKIIPAQVQPVVMLKWTLGFHDRFMGHGDYGIITEKGELVVSLVDRELAEHIIRMHNDSLKI